MPLYKYKIQNQKGEVLEDTIQGTSEEEVAASLKKDGFQVLSVKLPQKDVQLFGRGISVGEKAEFCRLLATMLRSGLSIPEAVDIIKKESTSKRLKSILADISYQTRKGSSMSATLTNYEKDFGVVFLTMVRAGEESGTLDQSFDYLSKQLAASYDLNQKVKAALMYPAVVIVAMFGNALLMFMFVLPRISEAFLKMDIELPLYTRIVLNTGKFIGDNTVVVIILVFIAGILAIIMIAWSKTRNMLLGLISKFGVIRRIMDQIDIARFARTLSTLLKSGVSIVQSLKVSAEGLGQQRLKKSALSFSEGVARGESLSTIMTESKTGFPSVVIQTIKAGEKTGTLEDVLLEMADFYEKEVDHSLKKFTSLLEPVLMLMIGVAVGIMVIVMIAPIYSIVGGLQNTIDR